MECCSRGNENGVLCVSSVEALGCSDRTCACCARQANLLTPGDELALGTRETITICTSYEPPHRSLHADLYDAGAPVRNEPHATSPALALNPSVTPGGGQQPHPGLRGKQTGPGAGGADPEKLASAVEHWPTESLLGSGSSASGGVVSLF